MNFIDAAILLILAITILGGYYRGFVTTALNIGATILSWAIAMLCIPLISGAVQGNEKLFNTMLYYTEGSEYVAMTDVELTRTPVRDISAETLRTGVRAKVMLTGMMGVSTDMTKALEDKGFYLCSCTCKSKTHIGNL